MANYAIDNVPSAVANVWFLVSGFYMAVQFFFSITFILTVIASLLTLAYLFTSRDADNFVYLLAILGGDMFVAGKLIDAKLKRKFQNPHIYRIQHTS